MQTGYGAKLYNDPKLYSQGYLDYITKRLKDYPKLSHTKIKDLIKEAEQKPLKYIENKHKVVNSNLNLVTQITKRYIPILKGTEFADVFEEGVIGLMKAFDKYDLNKYKNVSFKTYATFWIRAYAYKEVLKNNSTVYIPQEVNRSKLKLNNIRTKIYQQSGEVPPALKIINNMKNISQTVKNSLLQEVKIITFDEEKKITHIHNKNNTHFIHNIIKCLNLKEQFIIKSFFGMTKINQSAPQMKLKEIGLAMNPPLSMERVRQIKKKAIKKLRKHVDNNIFSFINKMSL